MINGLKNLTGIRVDATDTEIGNTRDFYFDDQDWTVRYMVVDLASDLGSRSVLISPYSVSMTDCEDRTICLNLNHEKVINSPNINTNEPVTRQQEELLTHYYDWPTYWNPAGGFALGVGDLSSVPMSELQADLREQQEDSQIAQEEGNDPHLRSANEVMGYHLMASDDTAGEISDFLIDNETWEILYLVVDINGILPGGKVIVSPSWVERVSWTQSMIYINLTLNAIKTSPKFDPDRLPDRDFESQLYEHFDKPKYWDKNLPDK